MMEFFKGLGRKMTGRKGIGNTMTVVIIVAVVLINILAYTVTNAFGLYFYSPNVDDLSISGNTDALFEKAIGMKRKVTITFCYPESKLEMHDTGSYVLETARNFKAQYIELKFASLITKMDEDGVIFPFDDYIKDGKYNLKQNSVIFETGERGSESWSYRVLTDNSTSAGFAGFFTLDSSLNVLAYNGEEVMAAMISWVLADEHPVAYFTQNHGETADVALTNLLTCAGYYIEVKDLRKEEIPKDAGMVIISNPTKDFEKSSDPTKVRGEIEKIEDYLKSGGKLYVALDPYAKRLSNLEELLGKWGIALSGSTNEDGVYARHIVREDTEAIKTDGYTFKAAIADEGLSKNVLDKVELYRENGILVREIAKLDLDATLGAKPVLVASDSSSVYVNGEVIDEKGGYPIAAYSRRAEAEGESTVFVMPSSYITASDALLSERYANKDFLYSVFEELFDSNSAPRGCNTVVYRTQILENLTMGKARIYTVIVLAIPAALAVTGAVIITRRKNR